MRSGSPRWGQQAAVVGRAVLPRPWLWLTALAVVNRMARRAWWRHRPYLPLPGDAYWDFRVTTAKGGVTAGPADGGVLTETDVVAYLQWCRSYRPRRG